MGQLLVGARLLEAERALVVFCAVYIVSKVKEITELIVWSHRTPHIGNRTNRL